MFFVFCFVVLFVFIYYKLLVIVVFAGRKTNYFTICVSQLLMAIQVTWARGT